MASKRKKIEFGDVVKIKKVVTEKGDDRTNVPGVVVQALNPKNRFRVRYAELDGTTTFDWFKRGDLIGSFTKYGDATRTDQAGPPDNNGKSHAPPDDGTDD